MMNPLEQINSESVDQTADSRFKITDLGSATWAMRKLKALDDQDTENNVVAQEQISSINEWLDRKKQINADSRQYLQGILSDYLFEQRVNDPKFKIDTPFGTVSTRKTAAGVNWSDAKVVESLKKQGLKDYIRVKEEPDKKAIKQGFKFVNGKYVNEDGQVLEGATEKESTINTVFKFN